MSKSRYFNIIAWCILAVTVIITVLFMLGGRLGLVSTGKTMGYEKRLFNTERVHTIDIVSNDWDSFIETCENEEYTEVSVVIDGESYRNVGIRAKGNTSLSSVRSMDSDRYSFKVEFDHYDSSKSYYGLDKLSLNNLIQDNTMMKDYLVYRLMNEMGVASPLCSFTYITVNGEDWGLYLAVEGIEDAFLERNYNSQGELYKPDSTSMGGGRGNGRDFDMNNFMDENFSEEEPDVSKGGNRFGGFDPSQMPEDFDPSQMKGDRGGFGGGGGMGSDDVKLKYIDDDPESYSNIFENAKTDISDTDSARLISSLKALSEGERLEEVVDIEAVIRYFAVHDFVVNGDSYTGSIIHNYYLHEDDGVLSMIPWDYNLAFGSFQSADAQSSVNSPIDTPVTSGDMSDRPMIAWIFENEEYTSLYHKVYRELIEKVDVEKIITSARDIITPYVERDPSKFCTVEQFKKGVEALLCFCSLRAESVSGQLNGTIPSTKEGQSAYPTALVDASSLNTSDMGSMGMGGGFGGNRGYRDFNRPDQNQVPEGMTRPDMPEGMTRPEMNEKGQMPEGMTSPEMPEKGQMPEGMTRPEMNDRQNFSQTETPSVVQENSKTPLIVLGSCLVLLALSLVITKVYKR